MKALSPPPPHLLLATALLLVLHHASHLPSFPTHLHLLTSPWSPFVEVHEATVLHSWWVLWPFPPTDTLVLQILDPLPFDRDLWCLLLRCRHLHGESSFSDGPCPLTPNKSNSPAYTGCDWPRSELPILPPPDAPSSKVLSSLHLLASLLLYQLQWAQPPIPGPTLPFPLTVGFLAEALWATPHSPSSQTSAHRDSLSPPCCGRLL